ncbi:MAG: DUF2142 domain-containing protein [Candidatus Gracilibacteria bacterium]
MIPAFFRKLSHLPLEFYYLPIACVFGLFMVFHMPPFQVMDEYNHFNKAYALSEGNILCTKNAAGKPGMYIPRSAWEAGKIMGVEKLPYHSDIKIQKEEIQRGSFVAVNENDKVFAEHPFCESPAWSSIPQALGILLGKLLGLSLLGIFYLGRAANLIAAVSIIFFALRKLPFGKPVFMFVALLPMFIQQISSYSLDAMHYSLLFFFYAWILELSYSDRKGKFSYKELSVFCLFSLFAIHAKIGFIFLSLLIFLLPRKRFSSTKAYALFTSAFVIAHVVFLLILRSLFSIGNYGNSGLVDREAQMMHILQHPFAFIQTLVNSINTSFDFYWKNLFGILGWMDYPLYNLHYLLLIIFAVFLLCGAHEDVPLSGKRRWFFAGLFALCSSMLFAILYILDDPVGGTLVSFMQGKYLLPLFPLLLLSFYHLKIKASHLKIAFVIITFCSFAATWMALNERYYDMVSVPIALPTNGSGGTILEVTPRNNLYQTFTSDKNNLKGVSIYLPAFSKKTDSPIRFILRDEECLNVLQSRDMRSELFIAEGYYTVDFDPIPDSKGKTYCMNIYPSAANSKVPFLLQGTVSDTYSKGTLNLGRLEQNGDVVMNLLYTK